MELEKALNNRRSIRKYLKKPVEKDKIIKIVEAGLIAPSAYNRQPWEIAILEKSKEKIADLMDLYAKEHSTNNTISKTASVIRNADKLILVFNVSEKKNNYDILSLGGMIENMLLQATALEVSSLWVADCIVVKEEINNLLNIPQEKELISAIVLGYSDYVPAYLPRKSFEEVIIYDE